MAAAGTALRKTQAALALASALALAPLCVLRGQQHDSQPRWWWWWGLLAFACLMPLAESLKAPALLHQRRRLAAHG